jgi:dTDP-4-amino-4,6-dideoxygalactose transaminase
VGRNPPMIPLVNLERQYQGLRDEMTSAIQQVLQSSSFILGPFVDTFEQELAGYLHVKRAVGCSSGTSAISLALEALGVSEGDEVITVGHTFAATASAIRHVGAAPIFADIEPASYGMDPEDLSRLISNRTKAIMPVHLYGAPCRMASINAIAAEKGIPVLEDAAQAHGADVDGRKVGGLARAATFSFYPGKNLGAYGDAGAVTTDDDTLADRIRSLRDHGRTGKYVHNVIGYNHRMDGLQGAILSVKLRYLTEWNSRRRQLAARYDSQLRPKGFKTIEPPNNTTSVYHLYVVEVSNRLKVQTALKERGIATGVHYPVPLHQQPAFAPWAGDRPLPATERIASRILSLPICGDLTDDEQDRVIDAFLEVAEP